MQTPTLKGWVDGKQFTETEGAAMSVEYRVVITRIQKKKKKSFSCPRILQIGKSYLMKKKNSSDVQEGHKRKIISNACGIYNLK